MGTVHNGAKCRDCNILRIDLKKAQMFGLNVCALLNLECWGTG